MLTRLIMPCPGALKYPRPAPNKLDGTYRHAATADLRSPTMQAVRRTIRRSPIRLRVALLATALAFTALAAVMYQHVTETSATFDQTARQQTLTVSQQVARATADTGAAVIGVIPFAREGLDGMTLFDDKGVVQGSGGPLGPALAQLSALALEAKRAGRPLQQYRVVIERRPLEQADRRRAQPVVGDRHDHRHGRPAEGRHARHRLPRQRGPRRACARVRSRPASACSPAR